MRAIIEAPVPIMLVDRLIRHATVGAAFLVPGLDRRAVERRARGREEARKLARADFAVVSYGKSGRTWLNVMLSRFFQVRFGLPEHSLLFFDNLHRKNPAIPTVLLTHDNYLRDFLGTGASKAAFYDKPTLLLVRHPADVAVSQYFQWRYRMRPHKKNLNDYPPHGAAVSVGDFVLRERAGLAKVVAFMNEWAAELPRLRRLLVLRYEDLRSQPERRLAEVLGWMGMSPTPEEVRQAVAFASFENMKRLEQRGVFRWSGVSMRPGDRANPDSYKTRRAKVGGYRDYFDDQEVRSIDDYVRANLDPVFGYGAPPGLAVAPERGRPVAVG
ncbi:MAG: sulfotransferase domain-containing protein [Rhodospirillaceae bacterium]|nr:sulfotransferase domain-containing protein [Rhodospirillaceae bacterium]